MTSGVVSTSKAERILDAARELLLRRGSRGVVISDVARLAHVGKGTVYLYWDTKDELVIELFVHDFVAVLDKVIATLAGAPHLVVPRRLFPLIQRTLREHPFLTAIRVRDHELLGLIGDHPTIQALIEAAGPSRFLTEALPVLRDHGIVRTDMPVEAQVYAANAILDGFLNLSGPYMWSTLKGVSSDDVEAVLSDVFRLVIEAGDPVEPPVIASAAAAISERIKSMREAAAAVIGRRGASRRGAA